MPLFTKSPTVYPLDPHAFLVRDLANATLQTSGTQTLDLISVRKGTVVVSAWIDVTTAAGAAGNIDLRRVNTGGSSFTILTRDANGTGITYTEDAEAGVFNDAWTHEGFLSMRKSGTGTNLVCSAYVLLLRPNMNP